MKSIIIDGVPGTWISDEEALEAGMDFGMDSVADSAMASEHFSYAEFACNHCGRYGDLIDVDTVDVLEKVRAHFGDRPVIVNSGVRCDQHNQNVGGATNSRHKTNYADAADIVVQGIPPSEVANYLESIDPGEWGIGRYSSFTHIDTRGNSARWTG